MAGKAGRSGPPGNINAFIHGARSFKNLLIEGGMDRRSSLFKALQVQERELSLALGGDLSPQQQILVADSIKTKLFVASLDAYLTKLTSLVRKGRCHPVLAERTRLAGHLRENLKVLGLQRVAKELPTLTDYLEGKYEERSNGEEKTDANT